MSEGNHQVRSPCVVYLGSDTGLPHRVRPLLAPHGIGLYALDDAAELDAVPPEGRAWPDLWVLLLDAGLVRPDQTIQELFATLSVQTHAAPRLAVIAPNRSIATRLQAMRAGADAYFVAPVGSRELAERLIALCHPKTGKAPRILVVEDDPAQAAIAERILASAGCETRTLTEALGIMEALEEFHPDLVVMDLHMPGASGAELAAIIREHDAFGVMPILFLSAELDPEKQVEALSMGGDAFIPKPIRPELLARLVMQRVASARALHRRLGSTEHTDPASGLSTRRHFLSCVDRSIAEPDIQEPGNGVLVITLDGASRISEAAGTGGADLVRNRIGKLIRDRLTRGDQAACLGEGCHAVLARRPGLDALEAFAEGLRAAVAATPLTVGGKSLGVSVSIGIGFFRPAADDAITMISRAEKACAAAMAAGGNRVSAPRPFVPGPEDTAYEQRIATLIDQALAGDGFRLFYQPMVAVQPQGLQCVEVMLRLADRDSELIPPQEFLPVAARSGRMLDVDRWLMLQALAVLKAQAQAQPGLRFFVFQTLASLASHGWILWLRDQLVTNDLIARRPILELHLPDVLEHMRRATVLFGMLRKLGIRVCLADVGDSPAAYDTVAELRPPLVKLAPTVVHTLTTERLNWLVQRLRRSEAEVIATGVDSPTLVGPVWASGVSFVQGTFIQAPQTEPVFDFSEVAVG